MQKFVEVTINVHGVSQVHRYPGDSTWDAGESVEGMLVISNLDSDQIACYPTGTWVCVREVSE